MTLTTDPNHPGIRRGRPDDTPVSQNEAYLVLSEEERARGFLRPVRRTYVHSVSGGPRYPLVELSEEDKRKWAAYDYHSYEEYPPGRHASGRFWTKSQLDSIREPCGQETTMALALAETYAADPWFYGATYCAVCKMHRPLEEFVWLDGESLEPSRWPDELSHSVFEAKKRRDQMQAVREIFLEVRGEYAASVLASVTVESRDDVRLLEAVRKCLDLSPVGRVTVERKLG